MRLALFGVFLCVPLVFDSQYAVAQRDPCQAVLEGGVFNQEKVATNSFAQRVVQNRFFQDHGGQSTRSKGGAIEVPLEGVSIGASYSQSKSEMWREVVKNSTDLNEVQQHEMHYLKLAADRHILDAWTRCQQGNKGGLSASFELSDDEKTAVLSLMWRQMIAFSDVFVAAVNQTASSAKVIDRGGCLTEGRKLTGGAACLVVFELPNAKEAISITISVRSTRTAAEGGHDLDTATVYLPPRLKWMTRTVPFEFPIPRDVPVGGKTPEGDQACFRADDKLPGSVIDAASLNMRPGGPPIDGVPREREAMMHCAGQISKVHTQGGSPIGARVCVDVTAQNAHARGSNGNTLHCTITLRGEVVKGEWQPRY